MTHYNIKHLTRTSPACPSQWEGETWNGDSIYIRYRHGGFTVEINDELVLSLDRPVDNDGYMSDEELTFLLTNLPAFTVPIIVNNFGDY